MHRSRILPLALLVLVILASLAAVPAAAVRSTEESLTDSLTRGSRFTVTITALPNTTYYLWLPRTFTMTGERYDQPPVIADHTLNLAKDPEGGPYTIGSYQYYNGNGRTIRDDVAPSTASMSSTNYYGQVRTDNSGLAVVEFQTSVYTGLRSYSVRVENPAAADSDRLDVALAVQSRKPPAMAISVPEPSLPPAPEPVESAATVTTATPPPPPVTTVAGTVTEEPAEPVKTTVPATRASALPFVAAAALAGIVLAGGHRRG